MTIVLDISQAGPPKRLIIEQAFSDCSMAGYEFGRTPEEINDALTRLNALMAEWKILRGIDLGYEQPAYGVGSAEELSGIPFETMNAVASFLALRIAPMMGAQLSGEARANMAMSLTLLQAQYADVVPMPRDSFTPRGMGSMHRRLYLGPFVNDWIDEDSTDDATAPTDDANPLP